ncbi:PrsW family glutamic-type intramembrane protease [Croceicoccus sp. BE223]|uniref:PrsW family glutamic-type intramembrane protease n=1 Tax=Croceicoccus sp. BE223 TaxID=2817716 RepID=UPI0028663D09|nr:PrsW family glutamic-type intramembrane protease [Croceicoccus sp. BE223]MDR7101632.1 RsiW-degrading membrane proteinase PrsW (M82 family) [Croceicoccus sp. BE223]
MDSLVALNVVLALTPVLLLLGAFLWLDVLHLLGKSTIVLLLVLGGIAAALAYPVSGQALDALPLGRSGYSRFIAPWIEEALKGAPIVWLFVMNRIGYKIDAALCGLAIGAGFAIVENAIYLAQDAGISPGVWLVRGAGTAVMHSGTAAIMAALSHQFNERSLLVHAGDWKFHPTAFLPGYLCAVALHVAFNQFPEKPLVAMAATMVVVPIAVIALFRYGAKEASHFLDVERQEHAADQPALEAGEWPDTECGRQLRVYVAERSDLPGLGSQVLEYWRLLGELVLSAESRMVERANGQRLDPQAELDRARFERLHAMERDFAPPTLRAVKRLLPFSRNDLWDIAELREQLKRH